MEELYYPIVAIILVLTLPLASRKLAYSWDGTRDYGELQALGISGRRVWWGIAVLVAILLVAFCVSKPDDAIDNVQYRQFYDMGGGDKIKKNLEPTFGMIVNMAPTYTIFLLIYALLSVGTHIYAIFKNSPCIWLSLFIYLSYLFVLHDFIQIRAAVASGLVLISVRYITERNWVKFFAFGIGACFFHYSAAIIFPFYFLFRSGLNKWIWTGILWGSVLLGLSEIGFGYLGSYIPVNFINNYFAAYMGNHDYDTNMATVTAMRILKAVVLTVMLWKLPEIKLRYPYAVPVLGLAILSQVSFLIFSDIPVLQGRIGEFLGAFDIFALAMLPLISKRYFYILAFVSIVISFRNLPTTSVLLAGDA